jgi:hypothetical protein
MHAFSCSLYKQYIRVAKNRTQKFQNGKRTEISKKKYKTLKKIENAVKCFEPYYEMHSKYKLAFYMLAILIHFLLFTSSFQVKAI